ncbi:MAG: tetratricopeptide repeat protein [Cyclobacteriaceae bacterium]
MPALISGYEHDVFISYRQKDNVYDGWVTEFVDNLRKELDATFKERVSVYFDANPHDGLLETHDVDKSVHNRIRCLILIPIVSQTYCDPTSFAWKSEFLPFVNLAREDSFGLNVRLQNGNVAGRVLPVRIHELDTEDAQLLAGALGAPLRAIDFTYRSPGVNRPLRSKDDQPGPGQPQYRDQINKVANAVKELVQAMRRSEQNSTDATPSSENTMPDARPASFLDQLKSRRVFRVAYLYVAIGLILAQIGVVVGPSAGVEPQLLKLGGYVLLGLFPLALVFAWFFEFAPGGLRRIASGLPNPYPHNQRKPFTSWGLILGLVALLLAQTIYFRWSWLTDSTTSETAAAAAGNSVAVLPLKNLGDQKSDEFFSDGLTEDIITQLSKIASLKVISRASTFSYKTSEEPLESIAAGLGVSSILEGSVQRSGDALRVRVHLFDVRTRNSLWAETYDRKVTDVLELQSEIARDIAQSLKANLSQFEQKQLDKKPTDNFSAYEFYMKGRENYYKYDEGSNFLALADFRKAVQLDPSFALAWAGLGDAYSQVHGRYKRGAVWIDSSLWAGNKSVELDSTLSEGYKALANAYNYLHQYDRGFTLLQKAVALNPNNAQAVGNLGTGYFLRGELDEALRWEKRAAGLNPRNFIPFQVVGWTYRLLGDYVQAEHWLKKSIELKPFRDTYEHLAYTYVAMGKADKARALVKPLLNLEKTAPVYETAGMISYFCNDFDDAQEYFEQAVSLNPDVGNDAYSTSPVYLGDILLRNKNLVDSEIYLQRAFELRQREMEMGSLDDELAFYLAGICAARGKADQSIQWLTVARERKWLDFLMAEKNPLFASVQNDPRFKDIISGLKANSAAMLKKASEY